MSGRSAYLVCLWAVALAMAVLAGCQSPDGPESFDGDQDGPAVTETLPAPDAVGVSTQASVTVAFDEPVNPGTVGPQNFVVTANGAEVPGAIVTDGSGRRFTYVPADSLPGNRAIDVEISGVVDRSGNMLPAPYHFAFHTSGDNPIPPRVPSNPYPGHGSNAAPIDTTFTWHGGSDAGDQVTYDFWLGRTASSLTRRAAGLSDPEFDPGPLAYATSYAWRVIASSASGVTQGPVWAFTTVASPDPNQPPAVPCNPSPAFDGDDVPVAIALDWECTGDPDGDDVTYDVYLGTSSDPPLVASVPGPPYQPPAELATSIRYYWRIEARDEHGAVSPSSLWHFDTVAPTLPNDPPSAPAPPISPADGSTILGLTTTLTWSDGVDPDGDPVSYLVRFGTTNPPNNLRTVSMRSTNIIGLAYDKTYYWQIVARDDHSHETLGPIWTFYTNAPPSAPCLTSPADGANNVLITSSLTWSCGVDPESDPVTFVVFLERNEGDDPDSVAATTSTTYTPPVPLEYSASYGWRIEARDGHGNATTSPVRDFETEDANQPPTTPCNPAPDDGADNVPPDNIRLRWGCGQDPEHDPETYDVYFGTTPEPNLIDTVGTRSYLLGGVEDTTTYYWKIVAKDDRGGMTEGPVWSFTTAGGAQPNQPPAEPCNPSPAIDAADVSVDVALDWECTTDPDGDAVTYDVYFGTTSEAPLVASVPGPPYQPPAELATDTRYYWRIQARDEHGAVTASPTWQFDTVASAPINDPPSAPEPPISPADGASILGIATTLTWSGGVDPDGDPVSYLVRFGTTNPPSNLRTVSVRSTAIIGLAFNETYYWQIVARDDHSHETPGPVWSCHTLGAPNEAPSAPCLTSPSDGEDNVLTTASLSWSCGIDPENRIR